MSILCRPVDAVEQQSALLNYAIHSNNVFQRVLLTVLHTGF